MGDLSTVMMVASGGKTSHVFASAILAWHGVLLAETASGSSISMTATEASLLARGENSCFCWIDPTKEPPRLAEKGPTNAMEGDTMATTNKMSSPRPYDGHVLSSLGV